MTKQVLDETRLAVGVDIGKEEFAVAIWLPNEKRAEDLGKMPNTPEGFAQLAQAVRMWQKRQGVGGVHLTLEPTGKYEAQLAFFAYQQEWRVSVVTPATVRNYAGSLGRRAKTDKQDAIMLARFTVDRQPPAWMPPPIALDELGMLLSRRHDLISMLQAERNRQQSFGVRVHVAPAVQHTLAQNIEQLSAALDEINQAIDDLLDNNPPYAEDAQRLDSIPGVGPKTTPPVLAMVMQWFLLTGGKGDHRGLAAYIGLDTITYESGRSVHRIGKISKKGNPLIRAALYQSALGSIRGHNPLHVYYDKLVASGKHKKKALVAVAHKILIWAWHIFISKKRYDPSLHAKPA